MKNLLYLLFTVFALNSFGQEWPGENPELLKGKTVKPKEIAENLQKYHYKNFFKEFDKEAKQFTTDDNKNRIFSSGPEYSTVSEYGKLLGKEFKVIEVYEIVAKYSFSNKEFAIELHNEEIGTVYYKYNAKYEHDFELEVVGGIDFPEGYFCQQITEEKDKFEDKITYYTPIESGFSFMKVITAGDTAIYLSVREYGSTLNVGEKGLYLLLSNGEKISRPNAELDTDVSSTGSGYTYSAFILLKKEEIQLLKEHLITDNRLYIYDGTVKEGSAKKIQEYLKCLTE